MVFQLYTTFRSNCREVFSLRAAIIGGQKSGKTTLYRLLTGSEDVLSRGKGENVGVMIVPDWRVEWLSNLFKPERTIHARLDLVEVEAYKGRDLLNAVRNLDVLIAVLGVFMSANGSEALSFLNDVETEFLLADLASCEGRLERLSKNKAKPVSPLEIPFLQKCKDALDNEIPLRKVQFEPFEKDFLANFSFYTMKPMILAVNVEEKSLASGDYPGREKIERTAADRNYPLVLFSGLVEEEIASLSSEDRLSFLKEFGLDESGVERIARATYASMDLISFFTVGEDEVKAWTIKKGTTAKQAAGKIHSDLEKGFIRAEVVSFEDLKTLGSMKACKEKGLLRLEGKDYVVKDGDIMTIRFNV